MPVRVPQQERGGYEGRKGRYAGRKEGYEGRKDICLYGQIPEQGLLLLPHFLQGRDKGRNGMKEGIKEGNGMKEGIKEGRKG
jgi:hypothetical protein